MTASRACPGDLRRRPGTNVSLRIVFRQVQVRNKKCCVPVLPATMTRECTQVPYFQAGMDLAKCFADFEWGVNIPATIHSLSEVEVCFFVDESGSMSTDCGGMTRSETVCFLP